jgi:hypothetical protein
MANLLEYMGEGRDQSCDEESGLPDEGVHASTRVSLGGGDETGPRTQDSQSPMIMVGGLMDLLLLCDEVQILCTHEILGVLPHLSLSTCVRVLLS